MPVFDHVCADHLSVEVSIACVKMQAYSSILQHVCLSIGEYCLDSSVEIKAPSYLVHPSQPM